MTPRTLTVISGFVLLLVFALAGWRARRRRATSEADENPRPRQPGP